MSEVMTTFAPSRRGPSSRFVIGKDAHGRWAALAEDGLAAGLFTNRKDAIRYARIEAGRQPREVRFAADPLELVFAAAATAAS
jgi:hypothetical protein